MDTRADMESRSRRLESELQSANSEKEFLRQHYERIVQENSDLMKVWTCCAISWLPSALGCAVCVAGGVTV